MKRIGLLMLVVFLAVMAILGAIALAVSSAGAATMQVSGTAPLWGDSLGTCSQPTLTRIPTGTLLTVHVLWWQAGGDSVNAAQDSLVRVVPGALWQLYENVASSLYRIRAFASVLPTIPGCDTTITRMVRGPAWKPTIN